MAKKKNKSEYMAAGSPVAGMIQAGNIDIANRPSVPNKGKTSTVLSAGYRFGNKEVLLPQIREGLNRPMTDVETVKHYKTTGEHLGIFADVQSSNEYGERLHKDQEIRGSLRKPNPAKPFGKNGVFTAKGRMSAFNG